MTAAEQRAARRLLSNRSAILPNAAELAKEEELVNAGIDEETAALCASVMNMDVSDEVMNSIIGVNQ